MIESAMSSRIEMIAIPNVCCF